MSDTLADIWTDRRVKIGYETAEDLAKCFNPDNWRGHPEAQADALDDSLETLGWIGSVKKNVVTGHLFDGHLRVTRALLKDPALQIPVDYYDLTPDEEALALQVHDAITEQAQPIPEKLAALMERTKAMVADRPGLSEMMNRMKEKLADRMLKEWDGSANDPNEEWQGMPEFENEDVFGAIATVKVHFESEEAISKFAQFVGQNVNTETKWIWYPKKEKLDLVNYRAVDES